MKTASKTSTHFSAAFATAATMSEAIRKTISATEGRPAVRRSRWSTIRRAQRRDQRRQRRPCGGVRSHRSSELRFSRSVHAMRAGSRGLSQAEDSSSRVSAHALRLRRRRQMDTRNELRVASAARLRSAGRRERLWQLRSASTRAERSLPLRRRPGANTAGQAICTCS
jgi:hypothetical protein